MSIGTCCAQDKYKSALVCPCFDTRVIFVVVTEIFCLESYLNMAKRKCMFNDSLRAKYRFINGINILLWVSDAKNVAQNLMFLIAAPVILNSV